MVFMGLSYYLTGYKIRYEDETLDRMCAKSLLLVFGIILGLSHLSLSQDWATFQKKHITNGLNINCNKVMYDKLYFIHDQCKILNTFVYSTAATVQANCRGVQGPKNVASSTIFKLTDCIRTSDKGPPCPYTSDSQDNVINVTCQRTRPFLFSVFSAVKV